MRSLVIYNYLKYEHNEWKKCEKIYLLKNNLLHIHVSHLSAHCILCTFSEDIHHHTS